MPKDIETVKKVARIAKINLDDKELEKFAADFENILEAFRNINEVSAEAKPAFHPIEIENVFREDVPEECLTHEEAMANAKLKEKGMFKGPRAV